MYRSFRLALSASVAILTSSLSLPSFAESADLSSAKLRETKTYHIALIDGVTVDGGARIGVYARPDTIINLAYMEEGFSFGNEYNMTSKSVDFGVQQFLGNSFYTNLAFRRMKLHSNNNNGTEPEITLWQTDNFARLAFGNQWQLMEGVTVNFEWVNLGAHLQRLQHSSEVKGYIGERRVEAERQAYRDERKANRFFYNALHIELGYSF
jgi:hypothetical protein